MPADYYVTAADMTTVADAIRSKTGKTELYDFPLGFVAAIESLKPLPKVRNWTIDDFDKQGTTYKIKSGIRQFFLIGDTFDIWDQTSYPDDFYFKSTRIPGLRAGGSGGQFRIDGTITGGEGLTDVMTLVYMYEEYETPMAFRTTDNGFIPIRSV